MSDVSKYTGGIPPLHTIKDADTRRVLEAIVAGWRTRNADLKPNSDERFITKGELQKLVENVNADYFSSPAGTELLIKVMGNSAVGRVVDSTAFDVFSGRLWAQLSTRIKPVDTSSIRTDIFQLQDDLDKANATLDTATGDILKLADGTTDIVVKTDDGATTIRAIKTTVYDPKTGLAAATAAIGEINNISVSSSSAAARQIAAVAAQVYDSTTGLAAANANITAINDVSANSSSAAAKALHGVRATVYDAATGLAAANASIAAINDVSANSSSAAAKALVAVTASTNQKNRTFFAAEKPASTTSYTLVVGDLWFDTTNKNKVHRWNGTGWDETADTRIAASETAITSEQTARVNSDNALAAAVNTIWSAIGDGSSLVQSGKETVTNTVGSVARAWNRVDAALKGTDGNYIRSITVQAEASAALTRVGDVEGRYSVKIDNNGYVTGFGLISTANNAAPSSEFIVRADRFSIVSPTGNKSAVVMTNNTIRVFDESGNLRVKIGNLG